MIANQLSNEVISDKISKRNSEVDAPTIILYRILCQLFLDEIDTWSDQSQISLTLKNKLVNPILLNIYIIPIVVGNSVPPLN